MGLKAREFRTLSDLIQAVAGRVDRSPLQTRNTVG
jgi:hypothetical protein